MAKTRRRTRRASPQRRATRSTKTRVSPIVPLAGLAALGAGAYLLWPRSAEAAVAPPAGDSGTTSSSTDTQSMTPPPSSLPANPTAPSAAQTRSLVERLRSSDVARQIYAFQAVLYSGSFTNERPDGIWGPASRAMATQARQLLGQPAVSAFTPNLIPQAIQAINIWRFRSNVATTKLVPDRLPQSIIDAVNDTGRRYDPVFSLQALPA